MDLNKTGNLLRDLRKSKGLTQKGVADRLGILSKTVSKWETGRGFPDVSVISALAEIYEVNERILLSGNLEKNKADSGNMKRTRFFVCPYCGSLAQGIGDFRVSCCGKTSEALKAKMPDEAHSVDVSVIENDFYIEFSHPMTKAHYITFAAYVGVDRVLTIKLYPEQDPVVRFPKMFGGKLYFYCNNHGLFEYKPQKK